MYSLPADPPSFFSKFTFELHTLIFDRIFNHPIKSIGDWSNNVRSKCIHKINKLYFLNYKSLNIIVELEIHRYFYLLNLRKSFCYNWFKRKKKYVVKIIRGVLTYNSGRNSCLLVINAFWRLVLRLKINISIFFIKVIKRWINGNYWEYCKERRIHIWLEIN